MGRGRPKKYHDGAVHVSVYLARPVAEMIEELARERGISKNEAINYLLYSADAELALSLQHRVSQLESLVREQIKTIKEYKEKLESLVGSKFRGLIWTPVEEDEMVTEVITEFEPEFKEMLERAKKIGRLSIDLDYWTKVVAKRVEDRALEKGLKCQQSSLLKILVRKELLKLKTKYEKVLGVTFKYT